MSVSVCIGGQQASAPSRGFLLITQRSEPTPGDFLPDLPEESGACWAVDHTCCSPVISRPVPVWDTDRQGENIDIY